jgi:hypothetical protein
MYMYATEYSSSLLLSHKSGHAGYRKKTIA